MKKIFLFGLIAVLFFAVQTVFAADFRSGDQVSTVASDTIQDDVYMAGGMVTHLGNVEGSVYAAGGTVSVNGPTKGDVVVAGGNVNISGDIGGTVRAAGGNISVQSAVGADVLIGGGSIIVGGPGIKRDVAVGGGLVRIDAPVGRNVWVGGGQVYLNGIINGNVEAQAESITIGKDAVINGNFHYKSPKEAVIQEGSKIIGKITYEPHKKNNETAIITIGAIVPFFMLLFGSLLFGLVFKKYMVMMVERAYKNSLREIGRGLVAVICVPIISIILLITIVGIPVGILGLIGFAAIIIFSFLLMPVFLGSMLLTWIIKRPHGQVDWKSIVTGALGVYILGWIPFIGWLAECILFLIIFGTIIYMKFSIAKEWR